MGGREQAEIFLIVIIMIKNLKSGLTSLFSLAQIYSFLIFLLCYICHTYIIIWVNLHVSRHAYRVQKRVLDILELVTGGCEPFYIGSKSRIQVLCKRNACS